MLTTAPLLTERHPVPPTAERLTLSGPSFSLTLDRSVSIGSTADNRVVLADARVSRHHCVIDVDADHVRVRDLGSTNGTYVNGVRVTAADLRAGASLELGDTRLWILSEARATRALDRLEGASARMTRLRANVTTLAPSRLTVLIRGETGTGKELVARALHELSGRRGPFVALNCGAIARELIESELFGHERGAFTGAGQKRAGLFEEAHQGTLFLDEIGELPIELQPRLLRVLESAVVRPVGGNRETRVEVRVVAATHVDLEEAVRAGRFREDLYFRLCGAELELPALRKRLDDLPALAERLLVEECAGDAPRRFSDGAMRVLLEHSWPGNVRELKNVIRRAVALGGRVLQPRDLGLARAVRFAPGAEHVRIDGRPFVEIEREILARTLERAHGSRRAAAKLLGIPKSTLCDKTRRYTIDDAVIPPPRALPPSDARASPRAEALRQAPAAAVEAVARAAEAAAEWEAKAGAE